MSEITVPEGRKIDYVKVSEFAESIKIIGLLHPITIDKNGRLVAGSHRLEAYKLLRHDQIECVVLDCDNLQIELVEIDENLKRKELDTISRGKLAIRREEIFDALGLRAKVGQGRPSKNGADSAPLKTTATLAKEAGVSERVFQEDKQIVSDLVSNAIDAVEMIKAPKRDMLKLSRKSHEEQEAIAKKILNGGATSIAEATSAALAKLTDEELDRWIERAKENGKSDTDAICERNRRTGTNFQDEVQEGKHSNGYCEKQIRNIKKASDKKGTAEEELYSLFLNTLGWERSLDDKVILTQLLDSAIECSISFTAKLEALRNEFVPKNDPPTPDGGSDNPPDGDVSGDRGGNGSPEPTGNGGGKSSEAATEDIFSEPVIVDDETTGCEGACFPSDDEIPQSTSGSPSQQGSDVDIPILFAKVDGKYDAKGRWTGVGKKFMVLTGSMINETEAKTLGTDAKALRAKLKGDVIVKYVFEDDYVFDSEFIAAQVISGVSNNGTNFWRELKASENGDAK